MKHLLLIGLNLFKDGEEPNFNEKSLVTKNIKAL